MSSVVRHVLFCGGNRIYVSFRHSRGLLLCSWQLAEAKGRQPGPSGTSGSQEREPHMAWLETRLWEEQVTYAFSGGVLPFTLDVPPPSPTSLGVLDVGTPSSGVGQASVQTASTVTVWLNQSSRSWSSSDSSLNDTVCSYLPTCWGLWLDQG